MNAGRKIARWSNHNEQIRASRKSGLLNPQDQLFKKHHTCGFYRKRFGLAKNHDFMGRNSLLTGFDPTICFCSIKALNLLAGLPFFSHFAPYGLFLATDLPLDMRYLRMKKLFALLRVIPTLTLFWHSFWHITWLEVNIMSYYGTKILTFHLTFFLAFSLASIQTCILSGIYFDILSGILRNTYSWQTFWHIFRHFIWHLFWLRHSFPHYVWPLIWHVFGSRRGPLWWKNGLACIPSRWCSRFGTS